MVAQPERRRTPIIFWPFVALWRLVTAILALTGRLLLIATGLVAGVVGIMLSLTFVGAIVGIPLALLGLLLVVRGIF